MRATYKLNIIVGPGGVAQLIGASSWCTQVAGSIPAQGKYRDQPMNAYKWNNKSMFLSLSSSLSKIHQLYTYNCLGMV